MTEPPTLPTLEAIVDASGVAEMIEACMPTGGRPRQLSVRTLLIGVLLALGDDRPAQLTRVHAALVCLPAADRDRLGVTTTTGRGPHTLTYRQVERTFGTAVATIDPTPVPSFAGVNTDDRQAHLGAARAAVDVEGCEQRLAAFCDALVEASVPDQHKATSTSYAVDWTDHASWARPSDPDIVGADPDASWGHRNTNTPGTKDGLFFGYYAQAATMVADEGGPAIPELIRRITLAAPAVDPPTLMAVVLQRMHHAGSGDRRRARRLRLRPPRRRAMGQPAATHRRPPHPGPSPPRPGTQGHLRRRDHRQRSALLPSHPARPAATRPARPRRQPTRHRRTRSALRRAGPLQTRTALRRRRRRLPPRRLPGHSRQAALPAAPRLDGPTV